MPHLDHDEPDLRQLLASASSRECVGHAFGLGPRIDIDDQGVLLVGIEVEGLPHVSVEIGDPIGGLDLERFRRFPPHGVELGEVRLLELHYLPAFAVPQNRDRRLVDSRAVVDQEFA